MKTLYLLSAATAVGAMAVPASAQYQYPQQSYPYPQQAYPQQAYPQQAYPGYPQTYAQPYSTNPIDQIVNQLLGNNYNVSERSLVSRCASAAIAQAHAQYGGYNGYGAYGAYGQRGYGYNQPYANNGYNNGYSQMRISAISNVERRRNGELRITGLISSGASPYGNAYGYQGQGYAQAGDLSFRCNVDYRGAVSGIRVSRAYSNYYRH
jgi:hypothetical protein